MYEMELAVATYSKSKSQPLTTIILLKWVAGWAWEDGITHALILSNFHMMNECIQLLLKLSQYNLQIPYHQNVPPMKL